MLDIGNMTLNQLLQRVESADRDITTSFIESHQDFIDYLYKTLDRIIGKIQQKRSLYFNCSEPQIAHFICLMLSENSLLADAKEINGNTDIAVEIAGKPYLWIGEAKFDESSKYVYGGYLQLATRYATFEENEREGGVLVFIRSHAMGEFMSTLKNDLPSLASEHRLTTHPCKNRSDYAFFTESNPDSIGKLQTYRIRFMGLNLYHIPEDSSALKAKIHKNNRAAIAKRRKKE